MKNEKGITLIALVITIVVLIILAGVVISLSLGENGIFNKAKYATEEYANEQAREEAEIAKVSNEIDGYVVANRDKTNINYSLTEQDTGLKWIDGKTIYQKTIDLGALPNETTKSVEHGIINMDCVVDFYGVIKNTSGAYLNLPYVHDRANQPQISANIDLTYVNIVGRERDSSMYSGYMTILYTKSES